MSPATSFLTVYNLIIVSDVSLFHGVQEHVAKMTGQNRREDYRYIIMSFELRAVRALCFMFDVT